MNAHVEIDAQSGDEGERLDATLPRKIPGLTRTLAQKLIEAGKVSVNAKVAKPAIRLSIGDRVAVDLDLPPSLSAEPQNIEIEVVYADRDLAIINKPAGLVVHPSAGHETGTLVNALMARFPQMQRVGEPMRPGIVHRLDKDTSGLLMVALSSHAQKSLQAQIAERTADRRYLAVVRGAVRPANGSIRAPIGRDPKDRRRMAVFGVGGRPAETSYRVLERLKSFTLLEAKLHTGRTHQIRAHFQSFGHPVAGDTTYGGPSVEGLTRQFLHAYKLSLISPSTGLPLTFQSELPQDLLAVLSHLKES